MEGKVPSEAIRRGCDQLFREMAADPSSVRGGVKVAMILRACFWYESIKMSSSFQRLSQLRDGRSQYKVIPFIWNLMNAKAEKPAAGSIYFKCVHALESTVDDWGVRLWMPRMAMDGQSKRWSIATTAADQ